jgi:hypothetical protein
MTAVYVLNNQYECIGTTVPKRALELIRRNRAMVVKVSDVKLRSTSEAYVVPVMIRLFYYVKAFGRAMHYTRNGVLERDNDTCQYCRAKVVGRKATIDHVKPQCQGGKDTYENCVCACIPCNNQKGGRTPEQAGMRLIRQPFKPVLSRALAQAHLEASRIMKEAFASEGFESLI